MTLPQAIAEIVVVEMPVLELTNVFHRVNNVLPDDQDPVFIEYDTSVNQALSIMKEKNYSQIPVVAGNEVLGIFSYRSFSSKVVGILDDLTRSLDKLDNRDVVLVGKHDRSIYQ